MKRLSNLSNILFLGFCTSGSQFGGISLAPLSQILFDRLGYAVTFRIFSALLLVVAISSLVYRSELGGNTSRPTSAKKSPKEMLNVWKSKAYIVWALGTTMVTLGYNIPRYTLVTMLCVLPRPSTLNGSLVAYVLHLLASSCNLRNIC